MGAVDADEQAAVVRLALQSLAALDVPTVLEISHMGYLTGLLDALHVPAEARAKLLDFLRAKNAHELRTAALDRKSTRLNSSHSGQSRMPSSA